jgi:hypothetical protein
MNVRYKYTLTSTAQIEGTRIVDFDLLTYNGTNQVIIMLPVNFTNITEGQLLQETWLHGM